ncbi:ABC transporter ATP-binding protein [Microbacterium sp. P04]|uniref:ABC transporter ATP-binding protein n=1 Tax=Microbacterium sp. P04 TaxID=3366947 RepID=UPI003745D4AC
MTDAGATPATNTPAIDGANGDRLSARVVVRREHFDVDVSLDVEAGETVAVMGPSGAGKSTLLAALAGLERLADGEVRVAERIVERASSPRVQVSPMARGIVLLGQEPRLFPHLSARENVAFGLRAGGVHRAAARAQADGWLERVGLPGAGGRFPAELSGGEQQRVAVARALAAGPRVILLDEPLVALDPETAGGIRAMLRAELADRTVVAVTHDAVDAVALADRLIVVEAGRVTQHGPVRTVLKRPATRFVASIAGLNRVDGISRAGAWERDGVRLTSASAPIAVDGTPLAAVFAPGSVRLARSGDSILPADNSWRARVTRLEPTPAGVRVHTEWCGVDLPLLDAASIVEGDEVQLRVAPEHVRLLSA